MTPRLRGRLADALLITAITAFTAVASQRWAGLDTPDSSFYASLGLFGDDVTDRSVIQSYYWTRLGYIAPVRALTGILGAWPGLAVYRVLLILLVVASLYVAARVFGSRSAAAVVTAILVMSTVVLAYLGNPYVTGSALAGISVAIAAGILPSRRACAVAGVALGWLAMTNPTGALLAGTIWLALRIHARRRALDLAIAGVAAAVTFGAFLLVGRVIFPRMDWFETYFTWNAKLNYSDFASREPVWLHDISLLVPLAVLIAAACSWALNRNERWAQLPFLISASSIGFMLVFSPIMGGIALEAPMYQAMLWPPALFATGILVAGRIGEVPWRPPAYAAAAVGLLLVVGAGHWPGAMTFALGLAVAVLLAALLVGGVGVWRRPDAPAAVVVIVLAMSLALASAQLLQNSRRALGLYYLSPYSNAFNDNPISDKLHTAVNAQEWLLSRTSDSDRILSWVDGDWAGGDRELYVVAAMQLWGENRVTLEPTPTADDIARLDSIRPSVLQLVGPRMDGILRFWSSLPGSLRASPPECYDFAWPMGAIAQGHSCLTRLDWTSS